MNMNISWWGSDNGAPLSSFGVPLSVSLEQNTNTAKVRVTLAFCDFCGGTFFHKTSLI